ncbi:GNAT family N-acetyltransferase [Rhodohalobacter sulfatireducens]|uniref:GNAT family N-acetyltransferase n=1 Tax=Rhodohalobacter sulfatireducens TaxID=2911366 RepID=A0ABS9KH01_9BACT|nr:GNAT family N-acetyltransferase [Rhodohalobacter sulfatireducens]MCG2590118.1 GNAT family N-acetyltransferase [Rhodohalobacter sulfatireducens]
MIKYEISHSDETNPTGFSRDQIADFLYKHLDEYGDTKSAILKCIGYAYGDNPGQDGFILIAHEEDEIVGAVIINKTNMSEYIPENILVYIAVHEKTRGQGVGKELMNRIIEATTGDIALHVEPNNPAKYLYEKVGFTNKYLEMRRSAKK